MPEEVKINELPLPLKFKSFAVIKNFSMHALFLFPGNQYWFGLRKPPCQFLFGICPCLQLFGNISYSLYSNQGNSNTSTNPISGGKSFYFLEFFNVKINYNKFYLFFLKEGHPQPRLHPRDPPVRNCQKSRWSTLTQRRKKPKKWKLQLVSQNLH